MNEILQRLGLSDDNPGTWLGSNSLEDKSAPLIESVNPANGEVIASVRSTTLAEYDTLIAHARESFRSWRKVPAPARGEAIRLVGNALRDHKDALGSLVSLEMGKIKVEGDGEVQEMIDITDFAVGQSRMLYGNAMHSERPEHRMYEQWHPLGLVGIITAFNFPVAVWSWNAAIAAICGNISVWKPSSKTPLCGIAVQKICNAALADAGFPEIFYTFNDGIHQLAQRLVDDKRIDLISFTGSTAVGRQVGEGVAQRLGKSLLELGGNNAIIVDEFANLDIAVPGIVFGSVGTAGQRCTTTRRIICHESRLDELKDRLVGAYSQVRIGDPLDADTLMGPLIDASAMDSLDGAVAAVKKAGGEILCGGSRL
ncbi:MAG: aldehyde dehydrogenase family protein, partial [Proteobacteria bacterium]|nr:aldehyde dehydrogenase family protein [Pseudomonadota bacterium]